MLQSSHCFVCREYAGWPNRATWHVALFVMNDETLHRAARLAAEDGPHALRALVSDVVWARGADAHMMVWALAEDALAVVDWEHLTQVLLEE